MFKIDDIVITPNKMPAIITDVLNNGFCYVVAEMPKLTNDEVLAKLIVNEGIPSVENIYSIDELKIPTKEERDRLAWLAKDGANFPVVN